MKVLKSVFLVIGLLVVIGAAVMAGVVTGIHLPILSNSKMGIPINCDSDDIIVR